jgi:hypothetical protein
MKRSGWGERSKFLYCFFNPSASTTALSMNAALETEMAPKLPGAMRKMREKTLICL